MPRFIPTPAILLRESREDIRSYVPQWLKKEIWMEQRGRCFYCGCACVQSNGVEMKMADQPDNLWTMDHMDPISRGGQSVRGNLLGCCKRCNWDKGNDKFIEYMPIVCSRRAMAKKLGITYWEAVEVEHATT